MFYNVMCKHFFPFR